MGQNIAFNPDTDIPDLSGKVIIVTGGNSGLGKESILRLAKGTPREIFMGARNRLKAKEAIAEIKSAVPGAKISFLEIDLSSFASIKRAADIFLAQSDRLDILLNNAGLMGVPPGLTEDGYESQFGTNHMGPALLTKLLMPTLEKTAKLPDSDVRIVNLSSDAFRLAPSSGLLLSQNKTPLAEQRGTTRYGQSKLANLYFTKSLAKHYPLIKSTAVNPGLVRTGITDNTTNSYPYISWIFSITFKLFFVTVEKGARPQLFAATGKSELVKSGAFYYPGVEEYAGNALINNAVLADTLWEWTERELKEHGF